MVDGFKYPANLTSPPFDKWVLFEAMSGRHLLRNTTIPENAGVDHALQSVALYLPDFAMKSMLGVNYAPNDLGSAAGAALQGGLAALAGIKDGGGENLADSILSTVKTTISTLAKTGQLPEGSFKEGIKAQLVSLFNSEASKLTDAGGNIVGSVLGQNVNPRTDLLFTAATYRTHNLDFLLVPRTLEEARAIDNICYFFNYYMLPRYKGETAGSTIGAFMIGFPYEFNITFHTAQPNGCDQIMQHVNRIGRSVLTNLTIDHTAGKTTAFIKDTGDYYPVATMLQLQFQEVRLLSRGDDEIQRNFNTTSFDNLNDDPRS